MSRRFSKEWLLLGSINNRSQIQSNHQFSGTSVKISPQFGRSWTWELPFPQFPFDSGTRERALCFVMYFWLRFLDIQFDSSASSSSQPYFPMQTCLPPTCFLNQCIFNSAFENRFVAVSASVLEADIAVLTYRVNQQQQRVEKKYLQFEIHTELTHSIVNVL